MDIGSGKTPVARSASPCNIATSTVVPRTARAREGEAGTMPIRACAFK